MIANISTRVDDYKNTLATSRFSQKVANIRTSSLVNEEANPEREVTRLQGIVKGHIKKEKERNREIEVRRLSLSISFF